MNSDKFNVLYEAIVDKKEDIDQNLKEISIISKNNYSHEVVDSLFEKYENREDIEEKVLILRILNKYWKQEITVEEAEKYLDCLLLYISNDDGKIRNTFISLIASFRVKILFKSSFAVNNLEAQKFSILNVKLVYSLMNLYDKEKDDKIKKSILKALYQTHSFGLERIIEKTEHIFRYREFKKLFRDG